MKVESPVIIKRHVMVNFNMNLDIEIVHSVIVTVVNFLMFIIIYSMLHLAFIDITVFLIEILYWFSFDYLNFDLTEQESIYEIISIYGDDEEILPEDISINYK